MQRRLHHRSVPGLIGVSRFKSSGFKVCRIRVKCVMVVDGLRFRRFGMRMKPTLVVFQGLKSVSQWFDPQFFVIAARAS